MSDDRPSVYEEDGRWVFRASALGSCLKSLTATAMGMTPDDHPEWLLRKFDEGNRGESVAMRLMTADNDSKAGWRWVEETDTTSYEWAEGQIVVEVAVGTEALIRGHLDGVCSVYVRQSESAYELRERRMGEVKCVTEGYADTVLRELPEMYRVQIATYMHWTKLDGLLILGIKDKDGNVVRVKTRGIGRGELGTMGGVKARVCEVMRRVEAGELGACDYRQWPCRYPWLCDEDEVPFTRDEDLLATLEASVEIARVQREERVGIE